MANPILPQKYHFGSDVGARFGKGLAEGVTDHFEMQKLRTAIEETDPNASIFDKMMKVQSLPLRKETKDFAAKFLEQEQKNQPKRVTGKDIGALTDTLLKQFPGFEEKFQDDPNYRMDFQNRLQRSLANDPSQDPYTVGAKLLLGGQQAQQAQLQGQQNQQQQPQQQGPGQPQRMPLQDVQDTIAGSSKGMTFGWGNLKPRDPGKLPGVTLETDRLENAFRQSSIGKVLGLHDSERLQELAEKNPEGFNGLMDSIGTNLIDAPVYIAMSSVMGPAGAMAALPAIAEASKHTWELARKHAKGGEVTEKDIEKAVGETMQEGLKGAVFGGVAQLRPLQKLVSAVPGGQKFLSSVIARSAIRVGELGVVAPAASNVLAKGELPSKQEIARNSLLALGFEAADLPGPSKGAKGAKPGEPPQLTGPKEPVAKGKGGLDSASALRDVQAAAQGIQRKQTSEKAASISKGAFPVQAVKPQAGQAANVPPGSEAQGNVSIPLGGPPDVKAGSPAPQERAPVVRQEAPSQTASQQNQAAIEQLQRNAARVPTPQGQAMQLEPLQEAGRMAQMRGEPVREVGPQEINVRKQPETLMKEQAKQDQVQKMVKDLEEDLRQLRGLQKERIGQKGEERTGIDKKVTQLQDQIRAQQKAIRKLSKELETGRESLTEPSIQNAITKLRQRIVKEALEPPEVSGKQQAQKIVREQRRKDALEKAKKLKGKEDNLPEGYSDSYIRVHEAYIKEYNDLIKNAEKQISNLKGDTSPEGIQERQVAERVRDASKRGLASAEADLTNHRHSKGAEFAKKQAETAAQHKERGKTEKKTGKVASRSKKDIERLAKEYAERPTKDLTEKVAEEIGVKPEEVKQATDQAKQAGEKAARKIVEFRRDRTKGEETPKDQPREKVKGEEDLQAMKQEAKEKAGEKKQDKTETNRSANREKAERQRLYKVAREFGDSVLKGKLADAFLKNPLGKAIIGQAALTAFDEVINEFFPEFKKFPKLGVVTLLAGGRNAIFRRIVSTVFNAGKVAMGAVSTRSDMNAYRDAVRATPYDPKRVLEAKKKLTPKQQKTALSR